MDSDDHLYVIDFSAGKQASPAKAEWLPDIDLHISSGDAKILDKRVMRNAETGGWRAFFKLDVPEKTHLLEMTSELKDGEKVISERWMYQWRR
jgi:glucans biosynthesis protein